MEETEVAFRSLSGPAFTSRGHIRSLGHCLITIKRPVYNDVRPTVDAVAPTRGGAIALRARLEQPDGTSAFRDHLYGTSESALAHSPLQLRKRDLPAIGWIMDRDDPLDVQLEPFDVSCQASRV